MTQGIHLSSVVAQSKWPVDSRVRNGPPEIDNLEATLEQCATSGAGLVWLA
jgi:hypothetical protein